MLLEERSYDDNELLRRLSAGDIAAFTVIYNRHKDRIFSYVFDLVQSRTLAEDILQDVFMKIWEQREELSGIAHFNAYLHKMVRNRAFDGFRRVAKEHEIIRDIIKRNNAGSDCTEETLLYRELRKKLHLAIRLLPRQQKQVYLLSREEGLTHEEIAQRLNIAVNTASKHMARALDSLKKALRLLLFLFLH